MFTIYLLFREDEAGNVGHVEEKVAHNIGRLGPGHLEAGAEPLVTVAVHHRVEPHVGQPVLRLAGLDTDGTAEVVLSAAPVSPGVSSHGPGLVRPPALPAPVGPRHPHRVLPAPLLVGALGHIFQLQL